MNRARDFQRRSARAEGFLLFEAMLAVTIFSLAVLGLGKCVDNCLQAETLTQDDGRARQVLENRMAEVEAGAIDLTATKTEELKGRYAGMTLKSSRAPLKRKNEKGDEIAGLFTVTLDLTWESRGEKQQRQLQFYVFPKPGQ